MTVFWRLLLAHLLADFVLHTDKIYDLKKRTRFYGVLTHGAVYMLCLFVCLWPYLKMHWFTLGRGIYFNGFNALTLLVLFHMLCDKIDKSDIMEVKGQNAFLFAAWQIIEVLILFLIFPILPVYGGNFLGGDKLLIVANGSLIVTYGFMVFIHLLERDFDKQEYPIFDVRYVTMLSRLLLYLSILLPSYVGCPLAIAWVVFLFTPIRRRIIEDYPLRSLLSLCLTVSFALLTKAVINL